jgi:hypothetical protein
MESGLIKKWWNDILREAGVRQSKLEQSAEVKPLTMRELREILVLFLVLCVPSIIAFLVEVAIKYQHKRNRNMISLMIVSV